MTSFRARRGAGTTPMRFVIDRFLHWPAFSGANILSYRVHRPFVIIFLISCALLGGLTFTLYTEARQTRAAGSWITYTYEVIRVARLCVTLAVDIETGQRGYLLTRNKEFLEPYNSGIARLDENFTQLRDMAQNDPAQQIHLQNAARLIGEMEKTLAAQVKRFEDPRGAMLSVEDLRASKALMDEFRSTMDAFIINERKRLDERRQNAEEKERNYLYTLVIGALLTIGGLLVANMMISNLMARSRKAEDQLQSAQDNYRLILKGIHDGIYDYNPQTGAARYSSSYEELLGYTPEEMPASIPDGLKLLHPDDYAPTKLLMDKFVNREIPTYTAIFRMRHKNGSWRWIMSRGVGVWDNKGVCTRMLGTHTDITEQKRHEEALRQLNAEMEGVIYMVSHDLRAPLVNMRGFASEIEHSLTQAKPLLDPVIEAMPEVPQKLLRQIFDTDIPESFGFIHSGVQRMDALTQAILDLSRVGRRDYKQEKVDPNAIVQRCLASLAYEINNRNVTVHAEPLPEVVTDPLALEQIIGNIIDNAIKYIDPARPGQITIRAAQHTWETVFSIEDNGRGIAPEDYRKVFDIFRRASNSGNVRGAGMGMATIKAVLRRLGGRIWFDSTLGVGTVFHFSIPAPYSASNPSHRQEAV